MKKGLYLVLSFFLVLLIMSSASANLLDSIKNIFTGKAASQPQDVSVQVSGKKAVIIEVPTISSSPIEGGVRIVFFTANVSDPNGVNDIVDSSIGTLINYGAITRVGTCNWSQDISTTKANYSCNVTMQYWDSPSPSASWKLNVSATDKGNKTMINQSAVFTYSEVKSLTISPNSLTWDSISSGDTDQNSTNDPTIINNSGNYNGQIKVTGIDLKGESINTEVIPASSFTVGPTNGAECSATSLVNGSAVAIGSSNSNPGNLSAGGGAGQSQLYYCIPAVPELSSQNYSTLGGGIWTIAY
jgi:hypothetical protein